MDGARRHGLAIAGAVALLGVGSLLVVGCGAIRHESVFADDRTITGTVREVRLDHSGSGSIQVTARDGATSTTVHRDVRYLDGRPGDTQDVSGDAVVLHGCGHYCWVDYRVEVPPGVKVTGVGDSGDLTLTGVDAVDLTCGSGRVTASGVRHDARFDLASGDLDLRDLGGELAAHTGSGNISVSGVAGPATLGADSGHVSASGLRDRTTARTGSGSVELWLAAARDVQAEAASGDVTVIVPRDRYRVHATSGSGQVQSALGDEPDAPRGLVLSSGSGDVTVQVG